MNRVSMIDLQANLMFCKKCNAETERGNRGQCKPCGRASSAAYRAANPDKARAASRASAAAWYADNTAKAKTKAAAWHAEHPDKVRAKGSAYRAANRDKVNAAVATWTEKNPEKRRVHNQNRRARKRAAGGKLSPDLAERLFKLQRGKCACCHVSIADGNHLDHVIPLALGGPNEDWNMQLLCGPCNLSKGAKHPIDFMQQRGLLL